MDFLEDAKWYLRRWVKETLVRDEGLEKKESGCFEGENGNETTRVQSKVLTPSCLEPIMGSVVTPK